MLWKYLMKENKYIFSMDHVQTHNFFNFLDLFLKIIKKIILNMLNNNKIFLHTDAGITDPINPTSGVRQGDIISPTLFRIFISPLLWYLKALN